MQRLMSTSDLFVSPRREQPPEGLGLVNIEAQAAGTRALMYDGISTEPLLKGCLHKQIPLGSGPEVWGRTALELPAVTSPRGCHHETISSLIMYEWLGRYGSCRL